MSTDVAAEPHPEPARDPQWLRGVLPLCLLAILAEGERYGYDLANRLALAGLGTIKGGTLYPVLGRLERDGLVAVRWVTTESGPARKYYALTARGSRHLASGANDWLRLTRSVMAIVEPVTDRAAVVDGHTP